MPKYLYVLEQLAQGKSLIGKVIAVLESFCELWSELHNLMLALLKVFSSLSYSLVYHVLNLLGPECVQDVAKPLLVDLQPVSLIR